MDAAVESDISHHEGGRVDKEQEIKRNPAQGDKPPVQGIDLNSHLLFFSVLLTECDSEKYAGPNSRGNRQDGMEAHLNPSSLKAEKRKTRNMIARRNVTARP